MISELHSRVIARIVEMFSRQVIQNDLRGIYVECMVAELLGKEWRIVSENWAGWDIEHTDGTRLEVKQSAAKQSWHPSEKGYSAPRFSIRQPSWVWTGALSEKVEGRPAHIYIFAWHELTSEIADHRDPHQWGFFVTLASELPDQQSIGLASVKKIASYSTAEHLAKTVESLRVHFQTEVKVQ